jgi:hypothetical protein
MIGHFAILKKVRHENRGDEREKMREERKE